MIAESTASSRIARISRSCAAASWSSTCFSTLCSSRSEPRSRPASPAVTSSSRERLGSRRSLRSSARNSRSSRSPSAAREAFDLARRRDQRLADEHALVPRRRPRRTHARSTCAHAVETSWDARRAASTVEPDAHVGGILGLGDVVELRVPGVLVATRSRTASASGSIRPGRAHLARGRLLREHAEAGGKRERERDDRVGDEHACGDAAPKRGALSALSHSKRSRARIVTRSTAFAPCARNHARLAEHAVTIVPPPSRSCSAMRSRAIVRAARGSANGKSPPAPEQAPPAAVPLELGGRRAQRLFEDPPRLVRDTEAAREPTGVVVAHRRGRVAQAFHAIELGGTELGERDGALVAKLERAARVRDEQRAARDLREQRASLDASARLVAGEPGDEAAAPLGLGHRSRRARRRPGERRRARARPARRSRNRREARLALSASGATRRAVHPGTVVGKRPQGALGTRRSETPAVRDAAGRFERRDERVLVLAALPTCEAPGAAPGERARDRDPGARSPRASYQVSVILPQGVSASLDSASDTGQVARQSFGQ